MNKLTIINICIINCLLAISSTIGMTIIPLIVVDSLGLSFFVLGLIEGISEFFSSTIRLYSGFFFDKKENKLQLILYPIYLALASKLLLLHPNTLMVVITKFIERLSNGAFGPLRDALTLKLSKNEGKDLALLNVSKSIGCLLGPLIVTFLLYFTTDYNILILLCVFLCLVALIIGFYLKQLPLNLTTIKTDNVTLKLKDLKDIKTIYPILILSFIFFLSRFNDGLILLFLRDSNYPQWIFLSTIGIFNAFMLIISPIIGNFLDKGYIKHCLYFSIISMLFFNIFATGLNTTNILLAFITLFFWGAQRVSSQMTFIYMIKQSIKPEYLGRAIGIYSLLTGLSVFIAASICGYLAKISFIYVFIYSFSWAFICLLFLVYFINTNKLEHKSVTSSSLSSH